MTGAILFTCTLPGRAIVKKNGLQRVYSFKKRRTVTTASDRYWAWENQAVWQLLQAWRGREPIACPIIARFLFYFENRKNEADLSNLYEGVQDALQKAGVIVNDKIIQGHDGSRKIFGQAARVEIELREIA